MAVRRVSLVENHRPVYVVWELTLRCDQPCTHCGSRAGEARADELDTEAALGVVRQLREADLSGIAEASVYGTLRRLYRSGLLTSYVVASDAGPHRKYYGLTSTGRRHMKRARDEWLEFSSAMNRLVGM